MSGRLWALFALFIVYGTTIPFNFSQGKGNGALAMRLAGPVEFTELPVAGQEPKPGPG